jgi:RNA 3'-terminal phosphate cyclase (ATP)
MTTDEILIDGAAGEGGGQILRTSLALSLVTGQPIVIENIRAGRPKPGLMRQHLTAVNAAARIGNARVTGAEIGSRSLTFEPNGVTPGEYHFSIGTAGSTTLVMQTILPALILASGPSLVTLEGGTHNQWAPPFHFLKHAYLPLINRMGPQVNARLDRHGFNPAGGGRFVVSIEPTATLKGFDLLHRGELRHHSATALIANLPPHIARREVETILQKMNWNQSCGRVEEVAASGPGNIVFTMLEHEYVTEVFTSFGRVGATAECVAKEVVRDTRNYLKVDAPVGAYLSDQIMLPLGISTWQSRSDLAPRSSSFRTLPLTRHSTTHIEMLRKLLGIVIEVTEHDDTSTTTVRFGAENFSI